MSDSLVLPQEFVKMIQDGDFDGSLDRIKAAIQSREKMVSRVTAVTMRAGDRFYIKNISPKYLSGLLVEFIEYTSGIAPVKVKMVYGAGYKYPEGRVINLREGHIGERE